MPTIKLQDNKLEQREHSKLLGKTKSSNRKSTCTSRVIGKAVERWKVEVKLKAIIIQTHHTVVKLGVLIIDVVEFSERSVEGYVCRSKHGQESLARINCTLRNLTHLEQLGSDQIVHRQLVTGTREVKKKTWKQMRLRSSVISGFGVYNW